MISASYPAFISMQDIQTSMVTHLVCCDIFGTSTVQALSWNVALQV